MNILPHDFIFQSNQPFTERCMKVYRYQAEKSAVFRSFINTYGLNEKSDLQLDEIPLLPIEAFKYKTIVIDKLNPDLQFKSSGTGSETRSIHHILDKDVYEKSIRKEFYRHFQADEYSILFYMPGYDKNPYSSLIWMSDHLIKLDKSGLSGYLPKEKKEIKNHLEKILSLNRKPVLFGAAFGILDLIDSGVDFFPDSLEVIETGGMKTHKREMSKEELRRKISKEFSIPQHQIHSEYGMCELLSQCYAIGNEWFDTPDWVYVSVRKSDNPREVCDVGEEGKIGIIDLANLHSCSFILTEDRGVLNHDGKFKVLGRWNTDNLRGCNFLIDS